MFVNPKDLSIDQFNYPLPKEKIANYPLSQRDHSKLLVYKQGQINDDFYYNFSKYIKPDSLVVFNNSKVVKARLVFPQESSPSIEIFCLEPADLQKEINAAMLETGAVEWRCFVGSAKKWRDAYLHLTVPSIEGLVLSAELVSREKDSFVIKFSWNIHLLSFAEILAETGKIPLPPYIKRETDESDKIRYQTIYAMHDGSVAAPTAGLHFTPEVLATLKNKNIETEYVTLHVGAGTFKPVKTETMGDFEMHSEQIVIEKKFLERLLNCLNQDIVAVGTTSMRTLESLYWLGLKIHKGVAEEGGALVINQWDPYNLEPSISPELAIQSIIKMLEEKHADVMIARTSIMIAPGYPWKIVKVLATNFHQPKSTLMLLVAAFIGNSWEEIYNHALQNDYRFLSYGDGSLLFRG